ncbi:Sir2 family NAD-dependent protein deacetylase [Lysinibacillus sp. BW-2-10]|uniref:Sir2 family NAD-dependent protein deacetylase n=1 Tax=Lysinibacillus sp. BW-2-10 TaxID=2590030 RepID=UPI00117E9650|nr:Sir2 family NAD-dependent protein deacetylase [Lysinibacillus sp. BW-2-10]TSI05293.1 hypothetical protein FJQ64_13395 [Lysinibacillus sp. BW-2-10]
MEKKKLKVHEGINHNRSTLFEKTIFEIKNISNVIKKTNKIVVLSGAGISTNSGIPDYRSSVQSMWRKNPEILGKLNQELFTTEPETFWEAFYQLIEESLSSLVPFRTHEALISTIKAIKPNSGHRFFTWLQNELQKDVTIITQNVDGLDKKAGSQKIIEMHGNIFEVICPQCLANYSLVEVLKKHSVPLCECGSVLRPNLVFFGDQVQQYNNAVKAVEEADLLMVVGTSMQVYPFNQLIYAKNEQAKLVLLNGESLVNTLEFHHAAFGEILNICSKLKEILTEK